MTIAAQVFALIVGIDIYDDSNGLGNLECSVADARSMKDFLLTDLKISEKNIRLLTDRAATRDGIIGNFRGHLIENPDIHRGDAILFYYAGHGSTSEISRTAEGEGDEHENQQVICPCDRGDDRVNDILDEELGVMLLELAKQKGDNVTVIMDCCHSGSGTRGVYVEGQPRRVRFARPLKHSRTFQSVDGKPLHYSFRHVAPAPRHRYADLSTHVLLAACRQDENAFEFGGSGYFTKSLLEQFRRHTLPRTSYLAIFSKIEPLNFEDEDDDKRKRRHKQTPQCEGKYKSRILFDGKPLGVDKRLVPLKYDRDTKTIRVDAGEMHGIVPGTRFAVRANNLYSSIHAVLGHVVANQVETVRCTVKPVELTFVPPESCYARVCFWADSPYKIAFTPSNTENQRLLEAIIDNLAETRNNVESHIVRVNQDDARLVVTIGGEELILERRGPLIAQNCPIQVRRSLRESFGSEIEIIDNVARFDRLLHHENPNHPYRSQVTVQLYRIEQASLMGRPVNNMEHIKNGRASLKHDSDGEYTIHLNNKSDVDLWCSVYYFDPADDSIRELYKPPTESGPAPLRKRMSLRIGDSASGQSPFLFFLGDDDDEDTGFLKIFYAEEYADLTMIEQGLEFSVKELNGISRGVRTSRLAKPGTWDEETIIVCLSRR